MPKRWRLRWSNSTPWRVFQDAGPQRHNSTRRIRASRNGFATSGPAPNVRLRRRSHLSSCGARTRASGSSSRPIASATSPASRRVRARTSANSSRPRPPRSRCRMRTSRIYEWCRRARCVGSRSRAVMAAASAVYYAMPICQECNPPWTTSIRGLRQPRRR